MSNKPVNFLKSKGIKKFPPSKSPTSTVSSSLYSGIASAERAIQRPGSSFSIQLQKLKGFNERMVFYAPENVTAIVRYHAWESRYDQFFIRENGKKCMAKDPYTPKIHSLAYAIESLTTQEECNPVLILPTAVRIEKLIIHGEPKPSLPNIVQPVRSNEIKAAERLAPQISTTKPSISQIQIKTKRSHPVIGTNNVALNLATTDRLLNRAKMRDDASVVRRPPRKSFLDTIHENITPLAIYG